MAQIEKQESRTLNFFNYTNIFSFHTSFVKSRRFCFIFVNINTLLQRHRKDLLHRN